MRIQKIVFGVLISMFLTSNVAAEGWLAWINDQLNSVVQEGVELQVKNEIDLAIEVIPAVIIQKSPIEVVPAAVVQESPVMVLQDKLPEASAYATSARWEKVTEEVCSRVFGLHPLLVGTGIAGLGAGLGALYLINKKTEQMEKANKEKNVTSQKPAVFKRNLRLAVLAAVAGVFRASEGYLHSIPTTSKLVVAGRCAPILGLGLGLLKGTDMLADWAAGKLNTSKYAPYVKNTIKTAGYLAGLYMGGMALLD